MSNRPKELDDHDRNPRYRGMLFGMPVFEDDTGRLDDLEPPILASPVFRWECPHTLRVDGICQQCRHREEGAAE